MLKPIFEIDFGAIPVYFLMLVMAFFAGLIVLNITMKRRHFSKFTRKQMRGSYYFSTLVGIASANIATWFLYEDIDRSSLYHLVTKGGFSFYFGLFGFLFALSLNALIRKYPVKSVVNIFVPTLAIIHFFARLGCMLRGCCYGETFFVLDTPIIFPARELECIFALIIFIVFIATERIIFFERLSIYLFSYSVFRFAIEFFRGDDRGQLFGIDLFSPAQIISLVVFVLIGLNWLIRLILKLTHSEESVKRAFADLKNKIFRKGQNKPRALRTFDCQEPIKKRIVLKIILPILLAGTVIFGVLVYFNPFNLPAFDSIRFAIEDAVSGLFEKGGTQDEIGRMNGADLLYIADNPKVVDGTDALTLVKESGNWANAELVVVEEKFLSNGKKAYVLRQVINGKYVLGSDCVLIVNQDGSADYLIGDEASISYTSEVTDSFITNTVTIDQAFGETAVVISQSPCYYDTGDGLIDANHVLLSENGSTPTLGAVVRADNGGIIRLTQATADAVASEGKLKIALVTQLMVDALKDADKGKIVSIKSSKLLAGAKKDDLKLADALENAYAASKLSPTEFSNLLCSVLDSIQSVRDISVQKFSSIIACEVRDAQLAAGSTEKVAESCSTKVSRAFTSSGFKETKDENMMHLTAGERRSTFDYKINYKDDEDAYTLDINENHSLSVTVRADKPVMLEVYNDSGSSVLSAYIEGEEEIDLFREDGQSFTLRVKDASFEDEFNQSGFGYKVSVQGIAAPEVPKDISGLLTTVEDSYNRSNLTSFLSVAISEGQIVSLEEAIAGGALGAATDSCVSSCAGMGDGVDTSKTIIATAIVPNSDQMGDQLAFLKGTEMELEYFDHKTEGNAAYICANLIITMDGMSIYDGYCYLQAEYITKDSLSEYSSSVGNEELDNLLSFAQGDRYYLVDSNSDLLYSVFGVTNGIPDSRSDLQSLYDMWEPRTMVVSSPEYPEYSVEVTYMYLDRERALTEGHSEDKVDGFEEYTARQNLMQAKMQKMMLVHQQNAFVAIAELTGPVTDLIGVISDPIGTGLDLLFGQNETSDGLWNAAKFIYNPGDYIEDAVGDVITDALVEESKIQAEHCALLITAWDEVIAIHTRTLQANLGEGTVVSGFFIDPQLLLNAPNVCRREM